MVGRGRDGHRWEFGGGMVGFHIYSPPRGKRKSCHSQGHILLYTKVEKIVKKQKAQSITAEPFNSTFNYDN